MNKGQREERPAQSSSIIQAHVLLTKGPFCTPRSVVRGLSTKAKPMTMQVQEEMKKLAEGGIGTFKSISEKEKVFFKPLDPTGNK